MTANENESEHRDRKTFCIVPSYIGTQGFISLILREKSDCEGKDHFSHAPRKRPGCTHFDL